jgi:hypothetical protein
VAVVLPRTDPLEAFYEVVADATDQGFTTRAAPDGACQQAWSREEAPFGPDADGFEFGGETSFGEPLPAGATVEAVACEVVAERDDQRMIISIRAALEGEGTAAFPSRSAILLTGTTAEAPESEFRRQLTDLQFPTFSEVPLTAEEIASAGLAEQAPLAPLGVVNLPPLGGCFGALLRSTGPPTEAVDDAIHQTGYADFFEGAPTETAIGDSNVVTHRAIIPAGGPLVSVSAVQTDAGSDVLVCSASG